MVLPTAFCLAIAACGSAPSVGDQIIAQGQGTAAIGTAWNQGNKLAADGQELANKGRGQIKDGQKEITDGQANIKAGDDMVARGKALMAQSEAQYKAAQAHPASVTLPPRK